jgi:hypothetical protein
MSDPYADAVYQSQLANWQQQQQTGPNSAVSLILNLLKDAQNKEGQARTDSLNRYYDTLNLLGLDRNASLADVANVGASRVADVNKAFNKLAGSQKVAAANQGLTGTSFNQARQRDTETQRQAALTNVNDSLLQNRINTRASTAAPIAGVMERRTDGYPDLGGLNQLMLGAGQAGVGAIGGGASAGNPGYNLPGLFTSLDNNHPSGQLSGTTGGTPVATMPPAATAGAVTSPVSTNGGYGAIGLPQASSSAPTPSRPAIAGPQPGTDAWYKANASVFRPGAAPSQEAQMVGQGYTPVGGGSYVRPGTGPLSGQIDPSGSQSTLHSQYVTSPPPAGTRVVQGTAQYAAPPGGGYGSDPFIQGLLGRMIQNYGGGYGTGYGGGYGSPSIDTRVIPSAGPNGYLKNINHRPGQNFAVGTTTDPTKPYYGSPMDAFVPGYAGQGPTGTYPMSNHPTAFDSPLSYLSPYWSGMSTRGGFMSNPAYAGM